MRKSLTIFCVFALSLFMVGYAFGESNANGYFKLDKNIATAGYQEDTANVTGIGASANVGFGVYAQGCDNLKGYTIKLEWVADKATYRTASGPNILIEDTTTINGASIDAANEECMLGASLIKAGETNSPGVYEVSYATTGSTVTTASGLLFYATLKTASTFKTDTVLSVKVSVTVADENGVQKFLGYRFFNVGPVAVQNQSWGQVKNQFKNF